MNNLVSFIIPVYNGKKYIKDSIESCINQTYKNVEIIIVDDGSTDGTSEIVKNYICSEDIKNIEYIRLEHRGKVAAINEGIRHVKGDYIAIQAADDICFDYRIQASVEEIFRTKAGLVFGDMEVVNVNLDTIHKSFWEKESIKIPSNNYLENLIYGNFVSGGTILFKNDLIDKIFPIPETLEFEDWWIAITAAFYSGISPVLKPLIKYRMHSSNDNNRAKEDVIDKRRRLLKRNINYYIEIEKFLEKNGLTKFVKIIKFNRLRDCLFFEPSFFKRLKILIKNIGIVLKCKNSREITKFVIYIALGNNLLKFKQSKCSPYKKQRGIYHA